MKQVFYLITTFLMALVSLIVLPPIAVVWAAIWLMSRILRRLQGRD